MNAKLNVLLVEDNPDEADSIRKMLPTAGDLGFAVHCVPSLSDAVTYLDQMETVDLTLLDLDLPDGNGVDTIQVVRNAAPHVPIVVMTGNQDEQIGIAAVKDGAQDYLLKGKTHPHHFCRVLRYAVERQSAEEKVHSSERLMRSALNALSAHIAIIDSSGQVVVTNKAWQAFIRADQTGALESMKNRARVKRNVILSKNRSTDATFEAGIRSVLNRDKDRFEMEYVYQCAQGQRWFRGQVTPFSVKDSRWVVVTHEDITDRKTAEHEKVQLAAQLRDTQKMEAIGTLAGGIAHDFNNILSAVLGFAELCLNEVKKGSRLEKNMREVYTAGNRAKDLVKQMLIYAGRDREKVQPTQISTIAKEVLTLIRSLSPPSIEIQDHIRSDAYVMINPIQIHQVFLNLCTNAINSMKADRGKLSVRVSEKKITKKFKDGKGELLPGRYLNIEIEDNGVGISKDRIDRIFEPYYYTPEDGEGSGLELAMVHSIIRRSNGDIRVRSEVGSGTCFKICLPIYMEAKNKFIRRTRELPRGKEHILFVDDELPIVNMNRQALRKLGYQVTGFCCSLDALSAIKAKPDGFDLVITDMTMPKMTGEQLAEQINKVNPALPIILCTGYSRTLIENESAEKGIKAVLMKPIPIRKMASKIRKILEMAKPG